MVEKRFGQVAQFVGRSFIAVCFIVLVTACEPLPSESRAPSCQPNDGSGNIYQTGVFPYVRKVIERASAFPTQVIPQNGVPGTPSASLGDATNSMPIFSTGTDLPPQQDAYLYLLNETIHTTNIRTVRQDNSDVVNVVITFLSPKLIQAAYLNDFLYRRQTPSDFESRLSTALNKTVERREFLFLVTLIPANRALPGISTYKVEVPMEKTTLMDSSGMTVPPDHVEYNLKQPFQTNQAPESGLLGYPMGKQTTSGCLSVLDPVYNTTIVIATEDVVINSVINGPYSWTIPYAPLVLDPEYPEPPLESFTFLDSIPNTLTPLLAPPAEINQTFWLDYSRFIWGKTTSGNY